MSAAVALGRGGQARPWGAQAALGGAFGLHEPRAPAWLPLCYVFLGILLCPLHLCVQPRDLCTADHTKQTFDSSHTSTETHRDAPSVAGHSAGLGAMVLRSPHDSPRACFTAWIVAITYPCRQHSPRRQRAAQEHFTKRERERVI